MLATLAKHPLKVLFAILTVYTLCMFIYPLVVSGGSWSYVQKVVERWQSINVGILALVTSLIAFWITQYSEEKQRIRNFTAARSFLPLALSKLCKHLELGRSILEKAWFEPAEVKDIGAYHYFSVEYMSAISNSIKYAEAREGEYLASLLSDLQVLDSRLAELTGSSVTWIEDSLGQHNLIYYFLEIAELRAKVNRLFNLARGEEPADLSPLKWEDYRNAYSNLNIDYDRVELPYEKVPCSKGAITLQSITEAAIENGDE